MKLVDISIFSNFSANAEEYGLQQAAKKLLNILSIRDVSVSGSIPSKKPVLIISNHPGSIDSWVMQSAITRLDFFQIVISGHQIMGKILAEHIFPIYRAKKRRDYFLNFASQQKISFGENLTKQEIQQRNREAISQAAKTINEGHTVAIYPEGSAGKRLQGQKWKAGIGYLVKQISNPETVIVFANINGTHKADILRFLHPSIRKLVFRKKSVTIQFSQPEEITKYNFSNPKEIARLLEERYNQLFQ